MKPQSTDRGPSSRAKANLLHPTMVNPVAERALKSHGVSTLPRTGFPPPSLLPKDLPHCRMTAPSAGQYSRAWDLWEMGQARVKGNGEKTFTEAQVPLECRGALQCCLLLAIPGNNNFKTPSCWELQTQEALGLERTPNLNDWPEVVHRITI